MNLAAIILKRTLKARPDPVWADDFKDTLLGYSKYELKGPDWVTGAQLSELFDCTRHTLNNWQKKFGFPKGISENNRLVTQYFSRMEIQTWINKALSGVSISPNPPPPTRPSIGFLAPKATPVQRDQEYWCSSMEKAVAKHLGFHKDCNLVQYLYETHVLKLN